MKREELKAYRPYANRDGFYHKSEADSVMDAYEQRIKELEAQLENVQNAMYAENVDANMSLIKANERIKELEAENERLKDELKNEKYAHERIREVKDVLKAENARLKAQVPKWHDVSKPL